MRVIRLGLKGLIDWVRRTKGESWEGDIPHLAALDFELAV